MVISAAARAAAKILAKQKYAKTAREWRKKNPDKIKAQQKKYYATRRLLRQRPEAKAKTSAYMKKYLQRPEVKAKKKVYQKAYSNTPEARARQKAYHQRPEVKAKKKVYQKAYSKTPEAKAKKRVWTKTSPVYAEWLVGPGKVKARAHEQSAERRAQVKAYNKRPEVIARKSYLRTAEVRTKRKVARTKLGFTLPLSLKLIDLKTGTLKKKLTRKERKKLGFAGNFFATGVAVGGLGLYAVSEKGGRR